MDPVVVADDVEKRYGETTALAGTSLSVDHGEVFALIGPNGAGKTTLVRTITGTVRPDAGTIRVLGTAPDRVDASRLGVLPQSFSPPARLTAREVLSYYASLYRHARDPASVLADVGLVDAADTWYENLSGGQQRRVCVGSTLLNDPDVLVLDEPTTGIDPAGRRTIHRLVENLAAGGTTVLLTTHDMDEAERLADRVGLLADGAILDVGKPTDLVDTHAGPNRLVVDLNDAGAPNESVADVVETVADRLSHRVARRGTRLVVYDVSPTDIGAVADHLEDLGLAYDGLRWTEPGLEDVYHALSPSEAGAMEPDDRESDADELGPNRAATDAGGVRS